MTTFNDTVIETFRTHDGVVGGHWEGKEMLLLHTNGRRTGKFPVVRIVALPR